MKPDWKDAPEWANWFAVDEDGACYWYGDEPFMSGGVWWARGKVMMCDIDGSEER